MSISSVNKNPCGDYPVLRSDVGEIFPVGIRMK
jgi:hypothetical protein